MNPSHRSPADVLDRQLRDARIRAFVGREEELNVFRTVLTERKQAFTMLYLYGPGGIGKSTLLLRFADESRRTRRPVIFLNPPAAYGAAPRLGAELTEAPVVLIDGFDPVEQSERWLRETVLPAYPSGTLIVVAARRPPSVDWRADLGWSDILRPRAVEPLAEPEATAMLRATGMPEERIAQARDFGRGNPLALRVAAQTVDADPAVTDEALQRNVALSIFPQLIGDIPSRAHRQALEVCAHAATTNEDLLRAAVPGADATELFGWLRDLPFVASEARGIYPSDVVRNVVEEELRWRDGDSFASMHARVKGHLIKRARGVASDAVLPFVADVIFVQRSETRQRPFFTRLSGFEVREHGYQPADLADVREMALRAEGADSARIVEFWLNRQPEAFYVYRRPGDPKAIAFSGWLRITRPTDEELGTDPVVAAAWVRAQTIMPLRPAGEHMGIARFSVDPASYHRPSEVMDLMQLRLAARIMCDDELAWSVIVTPDPGFWARTIERSHPKNDGPPVLVDDRPYTVYSQYFGSMPISEWSDIGDDLMLSRRSKSTAIAQSGAAAWTRTEFDQAVRHTLRSWRRPDVLADGRMIRSRMVAESGGDDAVAGLRRIFSDALATLRDDPRQAKYHRVLMATFIDGAPTQEAAAERLDLPFSTYRRHLGRGLDGLSALLWKVETHGISLLDAVPAPTVRCPE